MKKLIAILLHYANKKPPNSRKSAFYAVKSEILSKYGQKVGHDVQHIHKECYTCGGCGIFHSDWKVAEICWKCSGTGVYEEYWTLLTKYDFCGYEFHQPITKLYENPNYRTFGKIEGYIRHDAPKYYLAAECAFWLFLIYDRKTFWDMMGNIAYSSRKFTPMVLLSTLIFEISERYRRAMYRYNLIESPFKPKKKQELLPIDDMDDDLPF